jgi:preprotein translocase subunit SecD
VAPPRRAGAHPGRALALLAVLILVMLVGILGKQTFTPSKWQSQFKVGLGLDLSSGTQVVLQAELPKGQTPTAGEMSQAVSVIQSRVDGTGNSNATVQQQSSNLINVSVPGKGSQQTVDLISSTAKLRFRPVLLWQPYLGSTSTPSAKASGTATPSASPSGTSSPSPGSSAKASTSPTPTTSTTAKASTSALIVRDGASSATPKASTSATPKASSTSKAGATPTPSATPSTSATGPFGNPSAVNAATMKLFDKLVCKPGKNSTTVNDSWKSTVGYTEQQSQWDIVGNQTVSCDATGAKFVLGPAVFTGEDVTAVQPNLETNGTGWVVSITLNSKAAAAWQKLTENQYNNYYSGAQTGNENDAIDDQTAVVLDGDVVSAAETDQVLSQSFQIQGSSTQPFSQQYATYLSQVIQYGQLPLNFVQQSVSSISPTLGHASLVAGLLAGVIGLALVVIYLFAYYRGLGIVSVSSLLIAGGLAYFAVVLLSLYQGFTMTLAGIAGLVVAIGITADSFIVFFERLRDEVREGKALRPAVESGWKRARRTILVSDTVSFLAAVLLYHFATSEVQGFAYTLGLTTLIDVLVVFMFTKPMVTILAGTRFFSSGHPWSGLDPKRLGSRTPWRGGSRRTVRTQRTSSGRGSPSSAANSSSKPSSTTPREA